jgi:EmrB/QacA subfamily drug resistance transporter
MANTQTRRYILIVTVLTSFAGPLMLSAVTVALPTMATELSLNAVQLAWVSQSFGLSSAIFTIPFGRLADILGRKRLFAIGLITSTISSLLAAFSISFLMLISLRVIQGIGMAMMYSTGVALLTSTYPLPERGRVLGINLAGVYLGISLGPTIGGILTQNLGWRSIFFMSLVLQLPALILLFSRIKGEWAEAQGEKFDITGSALFSMMLFCILFGFSSLPSTQGIWTIIIGIIGLVAFIIWELRVKSPLLDIRVLSRNRLFAVSNLTQFMYYMAIFAIPFIMSLYLQYIRGFSPQNAGFVLLSQAVMQAALSPLAGRISDKIQPRVMVSGGLIIALIGLLLLFNTMENSTLLFIIISLVLLGIGHAFVISPNTNAIMSSVERKQYGVASAVDSVTRNIGTTFGMAIVMLLFSLYMGTAQITPANYASFIESIRMALAIFCILGFCCIFVSAARGKIPAR